MELISACHMHHNYPTIVLILPTDCSIFRSAISLKYSLYDIRPLRKYWKERYLKLYVTFPIHSHIFFIGDSVITSRAPLWLSF